MAVLGLHFCARAFSSCGKWGPLFIAVRGPLIIAASLVAEHRLQTRRLSSCGSQAQLLRGMWDPPRPGLEPTSPALAGRLSTTAPPGKPLLILKNIPVVSFLQALKCNRHTDMACSSQRWSETAESGRKKAGAGQLARCLPWWKVTEQARSPAFLLCFSSGLCLWPSPASVLRHAGSQGFLQNAGFLPFTPPGHLPP